jgi:hypothetical protein
LQSGLAHLTAGSHYDHEYSSNSFSSAQNSAESWRKLVPPGNRWQRRSHIRPFPRPVATTATARRRGSVELGTRAFDLLLVLLDADGALVTKQELLSRVWPGIVVAEENLKLQVSALRKALGADRNVIHTKFGTKFGHYRFAGVLGSNAATESCRSTGSKSPSGRILFPRSCRHSLQRSVNATVH